MSKSKQQRVVLKEFDISSIPFESKIVIIGKPATGKSTLVRCLCEYFADKYPVAKVFNGTEESSHYYQDNLFPALFIESEFKEDALREFLERQKLAKRDAEADQSINPRALLILDDVSDDPKMLKRPLVQTCFKNGRHLNMMTILALQYGMDIPPNIRTSTDYIFIFKETNKKQLKNLFENYGGITGDEETFKDIMAQVTGDYTALVINNRTQSQELEDCVFWFKAPYRTKPVQLGCEEYRKWSEVRYDSKYFMNQ